jgi:protein-tyrosine phosphatase
MKTVWLDLAGVVNARDVVGLPTGDGRAIQPGRLYRSDNLQELTATDIHELVGPLGVRSVVDLRTHAEVELEGPGPLDAMIGVAIHHLSLFPEVGEHTDAAAVPAAEPTDPAVAAAEPILPWHDDTTDRSTRAPGETYRRYLFERPDSVVAALRVIAEPDGATLVHCAAGKDRTGVVVAVALAEVGVQPEAIVADYVATAERIQDVVDRLASSPTYARDVEGVSLDRHRPAAATMQGLLEQMDALAGGVSGWLRANGWTDGDAAALRARLLDR